MNYSTPPKLDRAHRFMDAMKAAGCPICRCVLEEGRRSMETFLRDGLTNRHIRDEVRRDGGFCDRHSWQMARFGDAVGSAVLLKEVLTASLPSAGTTASASSFRPRFMRVSERPACTFCQMERHYLKSLVSELADNIDSPEVASGWTGVTLMCMPHLANLCAELRKDDARRLIIEIHRQKYAALCDEMTRFIVRQHQGRIEEAERETVSWLRAIEALVGMADIQ